MPLSEEQRRVQDALQQAIENQVSAYRDARSDTPEDRGVLVDWVVVMHTSGFDDEGNETSAYYLSYARGEMPDHRAIGLLEFGVHLIKFPTPDEDAE